VLHVVAPEEDFDESPTKDGQAFRADEEDENDIDIDIASRNIPNPAKSKTFVAPKHEVLKGIDEEQKHDNFFSINNQQQEEKQ